MFRRYCYLAVWLSHKTTKKEIKRLEILCTGFTPQRSSYLLIGDEAGSDGSATVNRRVNWGFRTAKSRDRTNWRWEVPEHRITPIPYRQHVVSENVFLRETYLTEFPYVILRAIR